eukprot:2213033-Rhodomonas_salina.1
MCYSSNLLLSNVSSTNPVLGAVSKGMGIWMNSNSSTFLNTSSSNSVWGSVSEGWGWRICWLRTRAQDVQGREWSEAWIFWQSTREQEVQGKWCEARGLLGSVWGQEGQGEKDEGNATHQKGIATAFFAMQNQVTI